MVSLFRIGCTIYDDIMTAMTVINICESMIMMAFNTFRSLTFKCDFCPLKKSNKVDSMNVYVVGSERVNYYYRSHLFLLSDVG